nr:patatin-like phospholipase family protein [Cupriavidus gilardii]
MAGIAWEIGVAAGLARGGVHLSTAQLFVGTSAGSVAGTQLACGVDIEYLLHQQLHPPADSPEQYRPYSQAEADAQNRKLFDKVGGDLAKARQRIGAFARRSATPPPAERRAIIMARLPRHEWPAAPLRVVAVDTESGLPRVFDAAAGCGLVDAVAASCAVPGTWPPVLIDGRHYMDGGIASMTNASVAADAARIVVLAPLGYSDGNPVSGHLRAEVSLLQQGGSSVHVVVPDEASLAALGDNVLDPARRSTAAQAGLEQGLGLAAAMASWWMTGTA